MEKIIEEFKKEVIEGCQRKPMFSFDENGKAVTKFRDSQKVACLIEKIVLRECDGHFVKCPKFKLNYDHIILDILLENDYVKYVWYYDCEQSAPGISEGLILELTNRGLLLKKAFQSDKTKEQERENCPLL